ncbi:MAG: hypothetical protein AB1918_13375 [Pseudomonadota bacterium]
MPLRDFLRSFFSTDMGRIVGANAHDGIQIGLHNQGDVISFLQTAYDEMTDDEPATFAEYLARMRDICSGSGFTGLSQHGRTYTFPDDRFTIVLPHGVLNLASTDDQQRFADKTGEIPGTTACIYALPPEERYFKLDPARHLGGDTLWFTFKTVVDKVLAEPNRADRTSADICRDILGLIHRQPGGAKELHLVALHIPSQVLRKNGHFRPTFFEANDHRRFSVKPRAHEVANDDPWGRTIDLEPFADNLGLRDGAHERLTLPFCQSDIAPDDVILFSPLGRVTVPRGNTTTDDDKAFADAVCNGRTAEDLLKMID